MGAPKECPTVRRNEVPEVKSRAEKPCADVPSVSTPTVVEKPLPEPVQSPVWLLSVAEEKQARHHEQDLQRICVLEKKQAAGRKIRPREEILLARKEAISNSLVMKKIRAGYARLEKTK